MHEKTIKARLNSHYLKNVAKSGDYGLYLKKAHKRHNKKRERSLPGKYSYS